MADRISSLPDTVLCHILSFLPTKESVATSVLSKRWKPLWRSVSALHFEQSPMDCNDIETHLRFVQSVYAFILSRDLDQPLQRLHLQCPSSLCDRVNFHAWISAALQRRVEHLQLWLACQTQLELPNLVSPSVLFQTNLLPSALFSCKTLVVLKLIGGLNMKPFSFDFSSVDLPSLRTLYLQYFWLEHRDLAELLCGSSNLEDLVVRDVYFFHTSVEAKFKRLSKLVRATIGKGHVPLGVVSNVEFLRINWLDVDFKPNKDKKDLIPEFQNLTHLKLSYYFRYTRDWVEVLEVLKHCSKLQILDIDMENIDTMAKGDEDEDEGADRPYPQSVPSCISLHLKTCSLSNYEGSKVELRFARYIMRNARHLHTMTIYTYANRREKFKMLKKLSLCPRHSRICKLSFI